MKTVYADAHVGFQRFGNSLSGGSHKSFILLKNIDLTGIRKFTYEYASKDKEGAIEVRIDSQAGPVISQAYYESTGSWDKTVTITGKVATPTTGRHDVYFFVMKPEKPNKDIINLKSIQFEQ